jgi:outer membrane lipoprotein-sorting protein
MLKVRRHLAGIIAAVLFCLAASLVQAAEMSADVITTAEGQTMHGKIFMKGDKIRNEFQAGGQTQVSILRPDQKKVWLLMPAEKMYMEMPITEETQEKMLIKKPEEQAKMKLVGTETVNGFECEKYEYEVTAPHKNQAVKHFVWIAKKLQMPIKAMAADGSFSMEYQNIKMGGVADSLFEVTQGYQKMAIPFQMPPMK